MEWNTETERRVQTNDSTLEDLWLGSTNLGVRGSVSLSAALRNNTTVTELNLFQTNLNDEAAAEIATSIRHNTSITRLSLRKNLFGATGTKAICDAVCENKTITWLSLSLNKIGKGAQALAKAIRCNNTIRQLWLTATELGDDGVVIIAEAFKHNRSIRWIHLSENHVGDRGAAALAQVLRHNSTITDLDLASNSITNRGATSIANALRENATISFLGIEDNKITSTFLQMRIEQLVEYNKLMPVFPEETASMLPQVVAIERGPTVENSKRMRNSITFLLSDPLVREEETSRPVEPRLDCSQERELISRCVQESGKDVNLSFHAATRARLQEVTRYGCLHFCGHGFLDQNGNSKICFEDAKGRAEFLSADQVYALIHHPVPSFNLVFIGACHSETTGRAFVDGGVQHVVCCANEAELNDEAAREFARSFYGALLQGHTVKFAFNRATETVRVGDGDEEAEKYKLLPEDKVHDVPVFDADDLERHEEPIIEDPQIPTPPVDFLGREIEMQSVLSEIVSRRRLFTIFGESGIGCSSLACALCHYINDRLDDTIVTIDSIFFVVRSEISSDLETSFLRPLYDQLPTAGNADKANKKGKELHELICETLRGSKALIVFDGIAGLEDTLCRFLSALFLKTQSIKVLLTAQQPTGFKSCSVVETSFLLGPLGKEQSAMLFGKMCPHADSGGERLDLLNVLLCRISSLGTSKDVESSESLIKMVRDGVPSRIVDTAKCTSCASYNKLFLDPLHLDSASMLFGKLCPHATSEHEQSDLSNVLLSELHTTATRPVTLPIIGTLRAGIPVKIIEVAKRMSMDEYHRIFLDPMNSRSGARLFGRMCPHFDESIEQVDSLSLFLFFHESVPTRIIQLATTISKEKYEEIMRGCAPFIGNRKNP